MLVAASRSGRISSPMIVCICITAAYRNPAANAASHCTTQRPATKHRWRHPGRASIYNATSATALDAAVAASSSDETHRLRWHARCTSRAAATGSVDKVRNILAQAIITEIE